MGCDLRDPRASRRAAPSRAWAGVRTGPGAARAQGRSAQGRWISQRPQSRPEFAGDSDSFL